MRSGRCKGSRNWSTFMGSLSAEIRTLGAGMTTAARECASTDSNAAQSITAAGNGIPAGHPAHGFQQQAGR